MDHDSTVTVRETESGFVATEATHRFAAQAQLDRGLVALAGVLVLASPLPWLIGVGAEDLRVAACAGLLLMAVATFFAGRRGVRKRITLDLSAGALRVESLSAAGDPRTAQIVRLDEIESIVVHRARGPNRPPELWARVRTASAAPLVILRGARDELEQLNLRLCTDHSVAQMAAQLSSETSAEPRPNGLFGSPKTKPRRVVGGQSQDRILSRSRRPAQVDGTS